MLSEKKNDGNMQRSSRSDSERIQSGGFDISDEEVRQAEQHCLRKIKVAGKGEGYFEMLFPDVLREYLFRKTLNAISLLSMMEVEDVQCMFTESM